MERLKAKGYLKNKKQSALWFSACRLLLFANYKTGNRYNHAPRCGTLWHGRASSVLRPAPSSVLRPAQSGAQVGIGQKCRTVDNQIGNAFFQSRLACVAGKTRFITLRC